MVVVLGSEEVDEVKSNSNCKTELDGKVTGNGDDGQKEPIKPLQLAVMVPQDAAPGVTFLQIDLDEHGRRLSIMVPEQAAPGDKLVLTEEDGSSAEDRRWSVKVVKTSSVPAVSVGSDDATGPTQLTVPVPADAIPGETWLEIDTGDGQRLSLKVPVEAMPGQDKLVLKRKDPSEEDCNDDDWHCTLVRLRNTRPATVRSREYDLSSLAIAEPLRAPVVPDDIAYRRLVKAIEAAGGFVSPKMVRGCGPMGVPGILTTEPIEAGEELCRIPLKLHISEHKSKEAAPQLHDSMEKAPGIPNERCDEAGLSSFLTLLLHNAEDRAVERASREARGEAIAEDDMTMGEIPEGMSAEPDVWRVWERYFDGLLAEDFLWHPYRQAASDIQAFREGMKPSPETQHVISMANDIIAVHGCAKGHVPKELGQRFELSMFLRARMSVLSRVFHAKHGSTLVPVVDLFNHTANPSVLWRWCDVDDAEIPCPPEGAMVVTAARAHEAGEELLDSYGARSNVLLFRTYGFTQPPELEPGWSCCLSPERQPPEVADIYTRFLPPASASPMIILDSKRLDEALVASLNAAVSAGNDAPEFLRQLVTASRKPYEQDDSLRPALEALRCIREKDPSSHAWWEGVGCEVSGNDFTRVKMSEYLCLTTYIEAYQHFADPESQPIDRCLERARGVTAVLQQALEMLKENHCFQMMSTVVEGPEIINPKGERVL